LLLLAFALLGACAFGFTKNQYYSNPKLDNL